jgi:hypothetical protein
VADNIAIFNQEESMELKEYLKAQFPTDLMGLRYQKPNIVIQKNLPLYKIDCWTIFFGGTSWVQIEKDIAHIDEQYRDFFFLCLFTITAIDMTMYAYYREQYQVFRECTRYPKFGNWGFGPHYGNPKEILLIPLKRSITDYSKILPNIDGYIDLLIAECNSFFTNVVPGIKTEEFIVKMINDKEFTVNGKAVGTIFETIMSKLRARF